MVNSSFQWFPGVPVFHSKDLVSWKQIGHVQDRSKPVGLSGYINSKGKPADNQAVFDWFEYQGL